MISKEPIHRQRKASRPKQRHHQRRKIPKAEGRTRSNRRRMPRPTVRRPGLISLLRRQARSNDNAANPPAQSSQAQQPSQTQQPSQAQSTQQPSSNSQPSQTQTNTAPPANNQSTSTQPSTGPANATNNPTNSGSAKQPSANTAAQPSSGQTNTAQSRTNINVSANLTESQRTHVSQSISRLNASR